MSCGRARHWSSSSAILVALGATEDEDVVLYEKEADQKRAPAALVRIMVGALALKTIQEKGIDTATTTGTYTLQCDNLITGTGVGVARYEDRGHLDAAGPG